MQDTQRNALYMYALLTVKNCVPLNILGGYKLGNIANMLNLNDG